MITTFLGQLHPVLLHLPIGVFSLAIIVFYFHPDKTTRLSRQMNFILLAASLSALVSVISGWLLGHSGDYQESAVNTHQWTAIAFTILSGAVYFLHRSSHAKNHTHKAFQPVFIAALIAMVFTGHAGGSLTHGADFLWPQQEEEEKQVKDTVRQMLQVATPALNTEPKLPVVAPVDTALIKELKASGFNIRLLAEGSGWLDVSTINMNTLTQQQFEQLVSISANMYGLSLADLQLTGIDLKLFGKLTQLRRLDIRSTPLGDSFLLVLSNLGNLEYLNLVGTTVSDEGLKYIVELKGLRKVYCWKTQISVEAINNLKLKYPQLSIITGL